MSVLTLPVTFLSGARADGGSESSEHTRPLTAKRVLITGGTGSIGRSLVRRLLGGELGKPAKVIVFSRDEAKQQSMRLEFEGFKYATDEIIYQDFLRPLDFQIGDIRDYHRVVSVLRDVDVVFNAAAMKQVPTCEYFPHEAVMTNVQGAENLVRAIEENSLSVETVVGISTDKACEPVNVMGMTKAIQERILVQANMRCPNTRFICVRYGNVLASTGSVVPLFREQVATGGPVTITHLEMTRFLLTLDQAVDTIFAALKSARRGEIYVPKIVSVRVIDVARAMIGSKPIETKIVGIRPGEKIHEVLVSREESHRTINRAGFYVLRPVIPEAAEPLPDLCLQAAYMSNDSPLDLASVRAILAENGLPSDESVTTQSVR